MTTALTRGFFEATVTESAILLELTGELVKAFTGI
jgi:hypothetical protein